MAAAAAEEVQNLLRFLTQDAKVPLATAMTKIGSLRKAKLSEPQAISQTSLPTIEEIFSDAKLSKQVFNAAKRVSNPKKRPAPGTSLPSKRMKVASAEHSDSPLEKEKALALPSIDSDVSLTNMSIETNRAPLVLAFAVTLLAYTQPRQPLSSRLSLAQAIVSANSRSKAQSIGIESGPSAEEEGWGKGQPKIKLLGREIPVMRRDGYLSSLEDAEKTGISGDADGTRKSNDDDEGEGAALWGLDLEALRKSKSASNAQLPIYTAEAARTYLLKSFKPVIEDAPPDSQATVTASPKKPKKKTPAELASEREHALASLLKCLDLLFQSWAATLGRSELDRRAWQWYLRVRPDVRQGEAGWGQRGYVKLGDILALRREGGQG